MPFANCSFPFVFCALGHRNAFLLNRFHRRFPRCACDTVRYFLGGARYLDTPSGGCFHRTSTACGVRHFGVGVAHRHARVGGARFVASRPIADGVVRPCRFAGGLTRTYGFRARGFRSAPQPGGLTAISRGVERSDTPGTRTKRNAPRPGVPDGGQVPSPAFRGWVGDVQSPKPRPGTTRRQRSLPAPGYPGPKPPVPEGRHGNSPAVHCRICRTR